MRVLPDHLKPYRTIGPFDKDSIPKGLLREHSTKRGTWAIVKVDSGTIKYCVTESGSEAEYDLVSGVSGVIVPEEKHHLKISGDVQLQIVFYQDSTSKST